MQVKRTGAEERRMAGACAACHAPDDVHRGGRGPKCDSCHTVDGWKKNRFDHERETGFALVGAHGRLQCQDCHKQADFKDKPPKIQDSIVMGKREKFYQTYCLVDQGFVKKNSEISVKEHMGQVAKQLGDEIVIRRFVRFQVGEATTA